MSAESTRRDHISMSAKLMDRIEDELENEDPDFDKVEHYLKKMTKNKDKILRLDEHVFKDVLHGEDSESLEKEMLAASDRKEEIEEFIQHVKKHKRNVSISLSQ